MDFLREVFDFIVEKAWAPLPQSQALEIQWGRGGFNTNTINRLPSGALLLNSSVDKLDSHFSKIHSCSLKDKN